MSHRPRVARVDGAGQLGLGEVGLGSARPWGLLEGGGWTSEPAPGVGTVECHRSSSTAVRWWCVLGPPDPRAWGLKRPSSPWAATPGPLGSRTSILWSLSPMLFQSL